MGPSLGRLGDPKGPSKCLESELPPPQWGRASEGSETVGILTATGTGCKVPQWGRASEGSETRAELEAVADGLGAAMGPSLGRLGDPASSPRRLCQPRHRAAMGPSLGRLGDPGLRARHLALIMAAAMGPSLGRLGDGSWNLGPLSRQNAGACEWAGSNAGNVATINGTTSLFWLVTVVASTSWVSERTGPLAVVEVTGICNFQGT